LRPRLTIPTPHGTITVRPDHGTEVDSGFLFRLFAAVKASEMPDRTLDPPMHETLLRLQFDSMMATYAHEFPNARFEIVERDEVPTGRIVTDVTRHRVRFVDIAVLPASQGRGLATALMIALLDEPRQLGIPAQVQVLATNTASLRLCARLGFVRSGETFPYVLLEWRG
jgi:GNAT superfamily N-acetyltransferase